jgi:hypothetical protein
MEEGGRREKTGPPFCVPALPAESTLSKRKIKTEAQVDFSADDLSADPSPDEAADAKSDEPRAAPPPDAATSSPDVEPFSSSAEPTPSREEPPPTPTSPPTEESFAPPESILMTLEERVRRLEEAMKVLQEAQKEERPSPPPDAVRLAPLAAPMARPAPEPPTALPAPEPLRERPASSAIAAATGLLRAGGRRPWLLFELIADARVLVRMYVDPRYRMTWVGRLVPLGVVVLIALSWYWLPGTSVPVFGYLWMKAIDVILCFVLFKVLFREARRYRDTSTDLPQHLRI